MITAKDVAKAHKILRGVVVNTPLEYDHYLSEKYGAKIYLKKENAQRVRSFKIRGAYFAISQLSKEERERGVVCASAGNHAQGVAYTCNDRFGMLLATGIGSMLCFEVMVNAGMTMGIMPVTGIPLPFISYGVSALTTNMISIGILLNISMQRTKYIF